MQIESVYTTSTLIGAGPRGEFAVHRSMSDNQGHQYHTIETFPYYSYSAAGLVEEIKEVGKNIDVKA